MIVVTGCGKSGTTACTKVLVDHGVFMGNYLDDSLEDLEFVVPINSFIRGSTSYTHLCGELISLISRRNLDHQLWGFKSPAAVYILGLLCGWVDDISVVWCKRDPNDSIESCRRSYHCRDYEAVRLVESRIAVLENLLPKLRTPIIEIDFTCHLPDQEIKRHLFKILYMDSTPPPATFPQKKKEVSLQCR